MVESTALEMRHTRKGIEGSNPSLSANFVAHAPRALRKGGARAGSPCSLPLRGVSGAEAYLIDPKLVAHALRALRKGGALGMRGAQTL